MKWLIAKKVLAGFGLGLILWGLVSVVSYRTLIELTEAAAQRYRTHEVLRELESVLSNLQAAETRQRGFILTGDDQYLERYSKCVLSVSQTVRHIEDATADNPEQQQHLKTLKLPLLSKLALLDEAIDARRRQGFEAASKIVKTGRGRVLTDEIVAIVHHMQDLESARLKLRDATTRATAHKAKQVILFGGLLGAGLILVAVLVLNHDIVARRRAEEELNRFFALSPDMLCIAGSDCRFRHVNPEWGKVLGWKIEELLSKSYLEFVHPEDREKTLAEAEKLTSTIAFENRFLCKDGSYKWLLWNSVSLPEEQLVFGAARDITERRQTEQALARAKEEAEGASRFKDQFLSMMSHELRTPLSVVLGFSELLAEERQGALNEHQRRYLNHIVSSGKHLHRLINDLLDISRIEAGRLKLHMEDVSVEGAIHEVVTGLQTLADNKQQGLSQHLEPDLVVRVDATRFKQVLLNLVGNAIKFTSKSGKVQIVARLSDSQVRVEVRDTGPGIPLEEQERIFEPFHRLQQPEGAEGTGLGLPISRRLVELQGGKLGLESQPSEGSRFYFTLPAVLSPKVKEASDGETRSRTSGTRRILVIEDDLSAAQLICSQLASAGYEGVPCDQPERAVEIAASLQPDAITLDIIMEPVNGWEVLRQLKSQARTSNIPIVLVTIVDQANMGAALGVDEYLVKPVEKATLLAAIDRCVSSPSVTRPNRPILVVEDDPAAREVIVTLLREEGYLVATATEGGEARAWVAANLPELVILDLLLPNVSGFELLAEWRANPRTADLPVVVLTGKELGEHEEEYLRQRISLLLKKHQPWKEELLRELGRLLKHQGTAAETA